MIQKNKTDDNKKQSKPIYRKWWFWVIVVMVIGIINSPNNTDVSKDTTKTTNQVETNISDDKNNDSSAPLDSKVTSKDYKAFKKVISDEKLIENICKAMREININPQKVSSVKKVDDWVAGERYNFHYKNVGLTIYTNMDSTVSSIRLGVDTYIYDQGYEPYNIEDYIVDSNMQDTLIMKAEDKVRGHLNYPSTADFPLLDWSFGRDHELYSVSSSVEAKNAFGVESEVPFKLIYKIKDNTSTLVYFSLGGQVIVNDKESLKRPERKEVAVQQETKSEEKTNTAEIVLVDGQLGEYGKEITLDGYKYINHHVPQGTYTVKNNVKWCKLYVAKDKYFKNSDGYMENEIVQTVELDSPDKTATITVNQGEHVEITLNASVTLIAE